FTKAAVSAKASTHASLKRRRPSTVSSRPHCLSKYGCGSMPTHSRPRTWPAATRRSPKPAGGVLVDWGMLKLLKRTNLAITLAQGFKCLHTRRDTLHGGDLWNIDLKRSAANLVAIKACTRR